MDVPSAVKDRLKRLRRAVPVEQVVTVVAGPAEGLRIGLRHASADYRSGANELPVQQAVADLLEPGATFFDIGSNVGFFAVLAARRVGPSGRVHAFEPVPAIADDIVANAERNGLKNVTVHTVAVSDSDDGTATLMLAAHPGGATLSEDDVPDDLTGRIEVPVVTIDRLVENGTCPPPDVVKIDVEGVEMQVLAGMAHVLAEHRPTLVCELDSPDPDVLAAKVDQWRATMDSVGYEVTDLADSYEGSGWHVYHAVARPSASTPSR